MQSTFRRLLSAAVAFGVATSAIGLASAPALADEKTLLVRFYDDPAGFDPSNIFRIENENIAFNIFSGLTTYDSQTGAIIPDLAESWNTDDNITWTFALRRGVQWQKGYGEFTAADVLYTFARNTDPATASPYASRLANVVSVTAPDDYTVVFVLDGPDGNFLHTVANYHQGMIVKKEAIEAAGNQVRWQPVGTGPYYLDSIDPTSRIVLKRHEDYFRGPAPIAVLDFRIIKDEATATIALRNGEIDLKMRSNRQENLDTLKAEGFKMNNVQDYAVLLRVLNTDHPALSDVRVRQAIAYAVDWEAITQAVSPSIANPAHSMLMPWMDVYASDVPRYDYNPEKARALLAEAGFGGGLTIRNLSTSAQGVTEIQQFEIDFLSQVGINMEMELVDTPTFNQRRNSGQFDTTTRLLPAVNPDMILFAYLHPSNMVPNGLNGARYDNPTLTKLLEAARGEVDPEKRMAMYAEVQRIALTDLPYIPLYTQNVFWPSKQNVIGVQPNYLAQVNFFEVDIE